MKFVFPVLVLLLFHPPISASLNDSLPSIQTSEGWRTLPWRFNTEKSRNSLIDTKAAIHGQYGLRWKYPALSLVAGFQVPFQKDFWYSFYLRVDEYDFRIPDPFHVNFMTITVSSALEQETRPNLLTLGIVRDSLSDTLWLESSVRITRGESLRNQARRVPLLLGHSYCIEAHISFFSKDSLAFELFSNNEKMSNIRQPYVYQESPIDIMAIMQRVAGTVSNHCLVSLDDFCISQERMFAIPPRPAINRVVVDSISDYLDPQNFRAKYSLPVFLCDTVHGFYPGEFNSNSAWRLFTDTSMMFPIYNALRSDPADCYSLILPFPLDSGGYTAQMRIRNNFNNWSDWSAPFSFQVHRNRASPARIKEVFFSEWADGNGRLSTLRPGQWFYLNLLFEKGVNWKDTGYIAVYLHDTSYTFGTPYNKGGKFLAASSYVFNYSFNNSTGALFERNKEGTTHSVKILTNTGGLYVGAPSHAVVFDTAKGIFRLPFRFLSKANTGKWHLVAFFKSSTVVRKPPSTIAVEDFSNIYVSSVDLAASDDWILILISSLLIVVVIVVFIWKRSLLKESKDIIFERIVKHINVHLGEKLTAGSICEQLKINENEFWAIFRKNNLKFSAHITQLRIEKAIMLLRSTSKNISDIAFETGFIGPEYFCKVFKDQTGQTPGEFRKAADISPK